MGTRLQWFQALQIRNKAINRGAQCAYSSTLASGLCRELFQRQCELNLYFRIIACGSFSNASPAPLYKGNPSMFSDSQCVGLGY